jgi:hypothetical protein
MSEAETRIGCGGRRDESREERRWFTLNRGNVERCMEPVEWQGGVTAAETLI